MERGKLLTLIFDNPALAAFEGGQPRKVLNYVHGGTFNFGGMDVIYEGPEPFVGEQDVIVVQFRVHHVF